MSRTRPLLSVGGAVAVLLTLAGCALLPGFPKASTATPSANPAIGQCWNATTTEAFGWADWKGAAATPCSSSHTLYTYDVGKISGETGSSWASPTDGSQLTDRIQTKAEDACSVSRVLPHLKWNQQLINEYFFVPTETQWKAGARWVRCDIGVLAVGTTLDNETFTALPARISTLVSEVSSDPKRFEFCMDSSTPVTESGPLGNSDATIADCRDHPQWTLAIEGKFPDAAGAPFPDEATSNALSSRVCLPGVKANNQIWIAYLPSKQEWESGLRYVDCWIGVKAPGDSAGTA